MRKIAVLLILTLALSGCATYKFQKSSSGNNGYVASFDGYPLPEYTIGKDKTLPQDLSLAKERFKRRRLAVETYYKKMDKIQSRTKQFLWEPPVMAAGFIWGVLRWPFIAAADYIYNHDAAYRAKMDRLDEEKEAMETANKEELRKKLDEFIARDLAQESGTSQEIAVQTPQATPVPAQEEAAPTQAEPPVQEKPVEEKITPPVKEEPVKQEAGQPAPVVEKEIPAPAVEVPAPAPVPPVAVISAKPLQGYSPLKVKFSAQKSYSKGGRIVAYSWDFGDGDTSTLKNPENTFWSTTFGKRSFTVTLTVKDQAGSVSTASSVIEVITR